MASTVKVNRTRPSASAENAEIGVRGSKYGEQFIQIVHGKKHNLADEGSYFIASSPTPGTPIALTTVLQPLWKQLVQSVVLCGCSIVNQRLQTIHACLS